MIKNKFRYKICYQNKINIFRSSKIERFNKNKWEKINQRPATLKKQHITEEKVFLKPLKKTFSSNLKSKKLLRAYYGNMSEKRYKTLYKKATNQRKSNPINTPTIILFINLLERRLDMVVFRMYFGESIFSAKQLIQHGKIFVNGNKVTTKSFQVQNGDLIEIDKSIHSTIIKNIENANYFFIPRYLECNFKLYKGIFLYSPSISEIVYPMKMNLKALSEAHKFN
jgi:small subunit ribosomal protein S4